MRELKMNELKYVSGAGDECESDEDSEEGSGNSIGGVSNFEELAADGIAVYEGLVEIASHIMERVGDAFD